VSRPIEIHARSRLLMRYDLKRSPKEPHRSPSRYTTRKVFIQNIKAKTKRFLRAPTRCYLLSPSQKLTPLPLRALLVPQLLRQPLHVYLAGYHLKIHPSADRLLPVPPENNVNKRQTRQQDRWYDDSGDVSALESLFALAALLVLVLMLSV
jgi:hypothetical protein